MFGRHRHTDSDPLLMGLGSSPSHQLKKTVVKDELDPLCIKNLDPRMCTQIIVLQLDACMQSKRNITSPYVYNAQGDLLFSLRAYTCIDFGKFLINKTIMFFFCIVNWGNTCHCDAFITIS